MDTTVAEMKRKLLALLDDEVQGGDSGGDPISGAQYTSDLLMESIRAALDAIVPKCWKPAVETLDFESEKTEYELPDGIVDIEGIYDNTNGVFMNQLSLMAGAQFTAFNGNAFIYYPYGSLTFVDELGVSGATLYYSMSWAIPEDDDDSLEPPNYALTALMLYAASYALLAKAVSAGGLAQFRTKVDSGQPTDNPVVDMSNYLLRRFEIAMQSMPMMRKGVTV